jgi:hypothetical protein
MKQTLYLLLILLFTQAANAQLIKDIGRGIKRDAEYRLERKARDVARKSIDSLAKKVKPKGKATTTVNKETKQQEPEAGEGFITLKLSTPVTTIGLSVTIRGASIRYGKWNAVKAQIKSPVDEEELNITLNDSGIYSLVYDKLREPGDYIVTVTSSDGKAKVSERLKVNDISQPDDEIKDLMDATGTAFERLKDRASRLKGMISSKDDVSLQTKISDVKEKLTALQNVLKDLKNAKKEIAALRKAGKIPSRNIRQNLTVLNQMTTSKADEVKKLTRLTQHEPSGNTICEYIAMVNEACAAFSTFTNGWTKTFGGVLKNIALDKGVPKATEKIISVAPDPDDVFRGEATGDEATWGAKEASKIFAGAIFDMEGLTSKLGKAGFAGDVVQFATDVLMKTHCGIFKGTVKHTYNYAAKNDQGVEWWAYDVESEAALILRYPKSSSGIIKMKGTIEGNATSFYFVADPALNSDYNQGTGGKVQTMVLKDYTPFSLPFATSLHDELGFGMVARALASPAYFLIPIDAEYNTETGKIKIFINEAIVDFLPTVFNSQVFIQWSAGLPKLRRMDYPISKARLTINAAVKEKNEFMVKKDGKGNPYIDETVKRRIGGEGGEREHNLDITISVKKE